MWNISEKEDESDMHPPAPPILPPVNFMGMPFAVASNNSTYARYSKNTYRRKTLYMQGTVRTHTGEELYICKVQ